jgi:hypothetical protein
MRGLAQSLQGQIRSAPVTTVNVSSRLWNFSFGAAARHNKFPEGGLRIAGRAVNLSFDNLTQPTTLNTLGLLTAGGTGWISVCPMAASSASSSSALNPFGGVSANTPVSSIASWFNFFRLRKLIIHYEAGCSSATPGTIQISYTRDLNQALARWSATAPQSYTATSFSQRGPVWQSQDVTCIDEKAADMADELFENVNASVAPTLANADQLRFFQGAVDFRGDQLGTGSAGTAYGRWSTSFVIDLYGFNQLAVDSSPTFRHEQGIRTEVEKVLRERAEEKKEEKSETDQPVQQSARWILVDDRKEEPEKAPRSIAATPGPKAR